MNDDDLEPRIEALAVLQRLDSQGLNRGSTGNLSLRAHAGGFWITPTGMPADELGVTDFVRLADDGGVLEGEWKPSSEWPFHRAIYRARPELNAVIHMHSPHATALACLRRPLPPFHYMVAVAGGDDVPCTPYHLFGTEALCGIYLQALAVGEPVLLTSRQMAEVILRFRTYGQATPDKG